MGGFQSSRSVGGSLCLRLKGCKLIRRKVRKLHRDLTKYYTEILGHRLPSQGPNLTTIAKDGNVEEAIKVHATVQRVFL
jgi:hypothetical protein